MSVGPAVVPVGRSAEAAPCGSAIVLLAIDSCGSSPGAALHDGSAAAPHIAHLEERPPRAEGLGACVQLLLDRTHRAVSSIRSLAVLTGPGSYTGLRTGLAFVRGLALLDGLPVVPVSALERLAVCACVEGGRVIAVWQISADLAVAVAYRIIDGIALVIDPGGALDGAQLENFVSQCTTATPGPWVLAVDREHAALADRPLPGICSANLERRVVDSQTMQVLARLGYAKFARGLGVSADSVLPEYFGTSFPRRNRNRVAAAFAG